MSRRALPLQSYHQYRMIGAYTKVAQWIALIALFRIPALSTCFVIPPRVEQQVTSSCRSRFAVRSCPQALPVKILKDHIDDDDVCEPPMFHRRSMIRAVIASTSSLLLPPYLFLGNQPCYAADGMSANKIRENPPQLSALSMSTSPESVNLPMGLLESRVMENVLSPPSYGMERSDITYPSWFLGTWNVASTMTSVQAPCGVSLFGSEAAYAAAQAYVGNTLSYESRFIDVGDPSISSSNSDSSRVIADRAFNVKSIAMAAMGPNCVLDMPLVSPNKVAIVLAPKGSPNPLKVDLFTLNRRQESIDTTHFHCSEVVREIISPVGNRDATSSSTSTGIKEIETTSLYHLLESPSSRNAMIQCRQRSATYLVPSQDNPALFRMWQLTQGKPVDVRFYDVIYTRNKE